MSILRSRGRLRSGTRSGLGSGGPPAGRHSNEPKQSAEDHEQDQPTQEQRKQRDVERRPFESKLPQHASAVEHPVPGRVRHNRRKDDRARTLGNRVAEEKLQKGNEQDKDKELAKLDADVERK